MRDDRGRRRPIRTISDDAADRARAADQQAIPLHVTEDAHPELVAALRDLPSPRPRAGWEDRILAAAHAKDAMVAILRAIGVVAPLDVVTATTRGDAVLLMVDFNLTLDASGLERLRAMAAALDPAPR